MVVIILPTMQSGGTEWQTFHLVASLSKHYKIHLWVYDDVHIDERLAKEFLSLSQVNIHFGVYIGLLQLIRLRPKIILSYAINYYIPEIVLKLSTGAHLLTERRNLYHWLKNQRRRRWQEILRNRLTVSIICNSSAVANVVKRTEPEVADRIRIIYNSVESIKYVTNFRRQMVAVGNIKPGKGIKEALSLFQKLEMEAAKHGVDFAVYGRCDDISLLADFDSEFVNRVWRGQMNKDQIFINAFCLVHLSKAEGFPNAVLEAIAYGVVPILSNIAPHRELFSDCSILVDDEVSAFEAVSRALGWVSNADNEFLLLREKCISRAAEFSISKRVRSYRELFNAYIN